MSASDRRTRPSWLRRRLLQGASVVVVAAALDAGHVQAQTAAILRGAAHIANTAGVPAIVAPATTSTAPMSAGMTSASARAILNQANAAKAVSLAQQAQAAARASAAALNPSVPNGLGVGALNPVTNPVSAANDPTGLSTWQGAKTPVQSTSGGQTTVTVTQTDARAILSWTSFNVGADTTLVYAPVSGATANSSWVTLNRVVGGIDPSTGLRNPSLAPSPSQILGKIKAPWEVLILNPNGVLFSGTSQVNTYSLVATSLDVGKALSTGSTPTPLTIGQRNQNFLTYGLLGYADQASANQKQSAYTFAAEAVSNIAYDPTLEGAVTVDAGAQISSASTGFLLFAAPKVVNAGTLLSPQGEVALESGRQITLKASNGTSNSIDSNVRGFVVSALNRADAAGNSVENAAGGLIEADDGYVSLGATAAGAVVNQGVLAASTSISRNGYVQLAAGDIQLAPGSAIAITPDNSGGTIPQDATSLADFKTSAISIGDASSRIDIGADSLIYAPSANVKIGAAAGSTTTLDGVSGGDSRIFVDTGAVIDVAGLTNVEVAASTNSVEISPVTTNDLQDSPNDLALKGATVFIDPRISGVRSDGVAWVGSPILSAAGYAEQVGVQVTQLMTKGGNVTLGVASANPSSSAKAPDVIVKPGATIDISGGWVTYDAGWVRTSRLIDSAGEVVDISQADPNATYIGVYTGYTASHPSWGVSQTFADPIQNGLRYEGAYTEGHDAGSLSIVGSVVALDGAVHAEAFAGTQQVLNAKPGTATSSIYGDGRSLQAAWTQLPAGGYLSIQGYGQAASGGATGAADIEVTSGSTGSSTADLTYGQDIAFDSQGVAAAPARDAASLLPTDRYDTILLSAPALSGMGLSELSLQTTGKITVDQGATVSLDAGGEFTALAGRALTVNGSISTASGKISLTTAQLLQQGSVINPDTPVLGSYDITINGALSVNGRWVNDYNAAAGALQGSAYLNGGSITMVAAPSVTAAASTASVVDTLSKAQPDVNTDISGSILVNPGALLNLSGGGYVSETGALNLTSKGGDLTLTEATTYFQLVNDGTRQSGSIEGIRVTGLVNTSGVATVEVNPATINARVAIAPGTILAGGFAGGGTFTLTTPAFSFGAEIAASGTELPLDFFHTTGFGSYDIVSYKTALLPNTFNNDLGGYNALLQTQVLTVGDSQTLNLTQSGFSPLVDAAQTAALRNLSTGGSLYSVLTPGTPTDAWDQLPVSLTLGGLIELDVAKSGQVIGAPGAGLTVSLLNNQGTIRLPGGTLTQSEILPALYTGGSLVAVDNLSQAFGGDGGVFQENTVNALGIANPTTGKVYTNAQLVGTYGIYLLGDLAQGVGVELAPGSVTDLSGEAVINPRASAVGQGVYTPIVTGKVWAGGTFQSLSGLNIGSALFTAPPGDSIYSLEDPIAVRVGDVVTATGATLNVSGASAVFDQQNAASDYAPTPVWSNGGALTFGGGAILQNVNLNAAGGASSALGGTLTIPNLVLTQSAPVKAGLNELAADDLEAAGIATLVAQGSLTSDGDVKLKLDRGFFLTSAVYGGTFGQDLSTAAGRDQLAPIVSATGDLEIDAPYIAFDSAFQSVSTPVSGVAADHAMTFSATAIDVIGAVRFDQSVATLNLDAQQDLRLIGSRPWQQTFDINASTVANSLEGQLAVNGDLNITAAQVYPTTGSSFSITSAATNGTIRFARSAGSDPAAPYSAGGSLRVQAANIIQGGVIRTPLGSVTLGADSALDQGSTEFAPATTSLTLLADSITSVSASGLSIPYGTTTDQTEWFFSPTSADPLTAPPAGMLDLAGRSVSIDQGSTVDVSGGGDAYAYEFIPGTGGSRDVLSQFNTEAFSSNGGYQYTDHRQVYAIVPGLSNAAVAAYDPIYASNYSSLYQPSQAGAAIYLNGGPGLAAGWYTLLPAQYAMLPGGMRAVQDTSAVLTPSAGGSVLKDGTIVVSGQYGVAGTGSMSSTVVTFDVQTQSTFEKYSDIALTSADKKFAATAAANGTVTPRLPIDAGRLVLDPIDALSILSPVLTNPGAGGRGAEADISGSSLDIVSALPATSTAGVIALTADELTQLNAASLLIGGQRSENSDGTTALTVTAKSITVENDAAHPLTAPEIVLAVDGGDSTIALRSGADIEAKGALGIGQTGDFIITGGSGQTAQGALLRVANGSERLVTRSDVAKGGPGRLIVGQSVTLDGQSVLLDASGNVRINPSLKLTATDLAIDSAQISFTSDTTTAGLVIDPALQAKLAAASRLTLRADGLISFASGSYQFADLNLDTAGLDTPSGGQVTISAGALGLANLGAAATDCASSASCGAGTLQIKASTIAFGSGTLRAAGFGGGVTLTAEKGVYADGAGGFDAGTADLTIQSPFLGDQATPATTGSTTSARASLAFTTSGAVTISNPTGAAAQAPAGTPGASLTVNAGSISVSGSTLRATAGQLSLTAASGISIADGAVLETPGYSRSFGDTADAYSIVAPGGRLSLTANGGAIDLASGTTLSVGGGAGAAGTLSLTATGAITLNATIDAAAPSGGASIVLDSGGAFDLSAFERQWGSAFTGDLSIRSTAGELSLASGLTVKAASVALTADGGLVDIAGTIDTSGVNGGAITLYGATGVSLDSGSTLISQAQGYASPGTTAGSTSNTDTRRATAGAITIGTDGTGVIDVASGATIDVSALHTAARLVPLASGGFGVYSYVAGDEGGSVTFRAPVLTRNGAEDVNVTVAGGVKGANSIILEGFEHVDLGAVAASGAYVGVTQSGNQVTLDLSQAGAASRPNYLADNAPGTLVNFIQAFDLTAANSHLGGLAAQSAFSARPGVELDYAGDITLASNWNLGAGAIDVAGAVKAGLMAADPDLPGKYYVLPGAEAAVFSNYTSLTYRTGGKVDGRPGMLTLRASGKLDIQGSITDGFFTFADQTDPGYVSLALGGGAPGTGARVNQAYLAPNCLLGDCGGVDTFGVSVSPSNFIYFLFPNSAGLTSSFTNPVPYSATANAPDALGQLATPTQSAGGGDPIGSAELFPLITRSSGTQVAQSWSYQLVGGAASSADPLRTVTSTAADVVVEGSHPYLLSAITPAGSYNSQLLLQSGSAMLSPAEWLKAFEAANSVADDAYTSVDFSGAPLAARQALATDAQAYYAAVLTTGGAGPNLKLSGASPTHPTSMQGTLQAISGFFAYIESGAAPVSFATISAAYHAPNTQPYTGTKTAYAPTLVRTGTGSIAIAAAGTIDLRNGATPSLQNANGDTAGIGAGGLQTGGVAIYTAGHIVQPAQQSAGDGSYLLDATQSGSSADIFASPPISGYRYGAGSSPTNPGVGFSGILLANPVYADGGGDVSLSAGLDVLGRRNVMQTARLNADYNASQSLGYTWIGQGDQAWRTGSVGAATDIRIDPQLFQEGVGALGGGSISIAAGRNVSDLSVVADTSVATAQIVASSSAGPSGQALVTYGGGDVSIKVTGDLLGGRVDLGSGSAVIAVGGDVASAGQIGAPLALTSNDLVLRLSDGEVSLSAGGAVQMQGVAALGVRGANQDYQNNLDAMGFYSADAGVSIVADVSVLIENTGINVHNDGDVLLTPAIAATGGVYDAVYPGSFEAVALTGDLNLATPGSVTGATQAASAIVMVPSARGSLTLAAAGDIASSVTVGTVTTTTKTTINMEDAGANLLPGAFSSFTTDAQGDALSGLSFAFNAVYSDTPQTTLAAMHNEIPTHLDDPTPNRIYAGSDMLDLVLELPKQTRIGAGRDIINMMFFGQNLSAGDITRITAGRDITATTTLVNPVVGLPDVLGAELPAVQGDTFVIGGPGSFFLEAGRNLGPFLNSAVTNGYTSDNGSITAAGTLTYGGGVLSIGDEWNPWLAQAGADIYTEFGVAKGQDFSALASAYLDPASLSSMPDYLFEQSTNAAGLSVADRTKPIYGPILIAWMQANAATLLNQLYGTSDVSFQQAYDAFVALPQLQQRQFLLKDVYFNELAQTSIPTSASYKAYARGYTAVNTLFPASLGYTANNLSGGSNGANELVSTGDLDLRLASIQTDQGGDIFILGPGGRVLAGSTVSTAEQAARRAYVGGSLFNGGAANGPLPSDIASIPVGKEGILTLQGGAIYSFTDQSFLLNQSRLFTEDGGDILMWSSNADLNAGQGPKTSADFPPIAVSVDEDLFSQINKDANVTGAGIAAFEPAANVAAPNVYLIAPRGTVDAGAAGVRVAGNLFIAANAVANADNFKVSGTSFGIPQTGAVNIGAQTSAGSAAAAAAANAQSVAGNQGAQNPHSQITVNIQGYAGDCPPDDQKCKR